MSIKIVLFSSFLSVFITDSLGQTCDEKGRVRIDGTYAKLLTIGGSGRKFPENKVQFKKYCNENAEFLKEVDVYKDKCLTQMTKQATGVIIYSVRNQIKQLCKKDSKKRNDIIHMTPCANTAKIQVDQCYTAFIDKMLGAFNAVPKMKIPHMCCDYVKLLECVYEKASSNKKCTEKQLGIFINWIEEMFGNVVDLLCGDYTEGSDKCETIAQTPKKKKSQKRTKSFMLPLIDNLASLPDA